MEETESLLKETMSRYADLEWQGEEDAQQIRLQAEAIMRAAGESTGEFRAEIITKKGREIRPFLP